MKRLFVTAILFSFLVSSAAFAAAGDVNTSNARLDALQVTNWQTDDDFVIWFNPARIIGNKNRVYGELGTYAAPALPAGSPGMNDESTGKWGGANYATSYGVWGLYIGRPYADDLTVMNQGVGVLTGVGYHGGFITDFRSLGAVPNSTFDKAVANPDNKFDLIYGKELSSMNFGVRLSYAAYSDTDDLGGTGAVTTSGKDISESSDITLALGAQMKYAPLDFALVYGKPSLKLENTTDDSATSTHDKISLADDGANNLTLMGRYMSGAGKPVNVITTARIGMINNSSVAKQEYSTTAGAGLDYLEKRSKNDKTTGIALDTALNTRPNADTLFIAAVGLNYATTTAKIKGVVETNRVTAGTVPAGSYEGTYAVSEEKGRYISIPLTIALEHQTFKIVKTRFSLSKPLYGSSSVTTVDETWTVGGGTTTQTATSRDKHTVLDNTPMSVAMGIGAEFSKSLLFDATVNQDVMFTGSYLLSGIPNTLLGKISVTYKF